MLTKKEKEKLKKIGHSFDITGVDDMYTLCDLIYDEVIICYAQNMGKNFFVSPLSASEVEFVECMMYKLDKNYVL